VNGQALMIAAATIAGLAGAAAHGGTLTLGDEAFTASVDEVALWPTEVDAKVRLRLSAELDAGDDGRASLEAATAERSDDATGIVGTGSIDLVSIEMETTSSGEFEDLLAPGSPTGSVVGSAVGVPLASTDGGSKGVPSTSETESSGSSWPGTDSTQDGQNLSSGERTGSSGASGTDLPPAQSVPGSGVAAVALMGLASASRRRR
jgi:hypothetical protein